MKVKLKNLIIRYNDYRKAFKLLTKKESYKNLPLRLRIVMRIAGFGVVIGI
jgi:hypothetical protein